MEALRVLIIEDNALIAAALSEMLADMGHGVCATAATEAEAVVAANRYKPDLMIVDAGLGGGSGVSAVKKILRAKPVAHVFVTGDPRRVHARMAGNPVVCKPFHAAELAKAIQIALAAAAPPL